MEKESGVPSSQEIIDRLLNEQTVKEKGPSDAVKARSGRRKAAYCLTGLTALLGGLYALNFVRESWADRSLEDTVEPQDFFQLTDSTTKDNICIKVLELAGASNRKISGWILQHPPTSEVARVGDSGPAAEEESPSPVPTLVFFHGLHTNVGWLLPKMTELFQATGCNVVMLNYRDNVLRRTENDQLNAMNDMTAAVKDLMENNPQLIKSPKVYLMGSGLGAEVAVHVASELGSKKIGAVVLQNPRQGVPMVVDKFPVPNWLRFLTPTWLVQCGSRVADSITEKIARTKVPLALYATEECSQAVAIDLFTKSRAGRRTLANASPVAATLTGLSCLDRERRWHSLIKDFVQEIEQSSPEAVTVANLYPTHVDKAEDAQC